MARRSCAETRVSKLIGDYEYQLRVDDQGIVRAYYRLSDARLHDFRRIPARDLPDELKDKFAELARQSREQLEI
mgnify:CR=1 FL=1